MAKRRFNLDDNFEDVGSFIEAPKESQPATHIPEPVSQEQPVEKAVLHNEPNKLFRRNITLSEEVLWRLNYIKDRKNKNRQDGDKFVTIDGLMFEMIQQCLDNQYASTKRKFDEYKNEEAEDWM